MSKKEIESLSATIRVLPCQTAPSNKMFFTNKKDDNSAREDNYIIIHESYSRRKAINLSTKQITGISVSLFTTFPQLTELCLDNNDITVLPAKIGQLKSLTVLTLNHNRLHCLPITLTELDKLHALLLHNNKITYLPPEFAKLRDLQSLTLHNNQFAELPAIFHSFPNLNEISIQWFVYLTIPQKRLIKNKSHGIQIIAQLKYLCQTLSAQNIETFTFDSFQKHFDQFPNSSNEGSFISEKLLPLACRYNDITFIKELLQKEGPKLDLSSSNNRTPLAIAIKESNLELIEILLGYHVRNKIKLKDSELHLHMATVTVNPYVVDLLLKYNVDPNATDRDGNTALHIAMTSFNQHPAKIGVICQSLLNSGAEPNWKNKSNFAPIHLVAKQGQALALQWIVNYNRETQSKDLTASKIFKLNIKGGNEEWTPLHYASNSGYIEVVELLTKADTKLFKRSNQNLLPKQTNVANFITYKILLKAENHFIKKNIVKPTHSSTQIYSDAFINNENEVDIKAQTTTGSKRVSIFMKSQVKNMKKVVTTCTPEQLNTTISCNSIDVMSLNDSDCSLDTSIDEKMQVLQCLNIERSKLSGSSDVKILEAPFIDVNRPGSCESRSALQPVRAISENAERLACYQGPKLFKLNNTFGPKKELNLKVLDYLRKGTNRSNIIQEIENKALMNQKKRILSVDTNTIEKLQCLNYIRSVREFKVIRLFLFGILEEVNHKMDDLNESFLIVMKEIFHLLYFSIKTTPLEKVEQRILVDLYKKLQNRLVYRKEIKNILGRAQGY